MIVQPDKCVVFDRVVQVLDVAKNAGLECLGIASEQKGLIGHHSSSFVDLEAFSSDRPTTAACLKTDHDLLRWEQIL